jgi:hypothetical protein
VSVETGITEGGIPDMNGCDAGVEFWVENKMTHGWQVDINTDQVGWLRRRSRKGGRCFVAVRRMCEKGPRRERADELWLYRGEDAELLRDLGLRGLFPLGSWVGGPSRWAWGEVERVLMGARKPSRGLRAQK